MASYDLYGTDLSSLTKKVCNFFKDYGEEQVFFPESLGFPTYHDIRGKNPRCIPEEVMEEDYYPVMNDESLTDIINSCSKLQRHHFPQLNDLILTIERDYMIDGQTLPIRIRYTSKEGHEDIYAKKMNVSRIFIKSLYEIIDRKPSRFSFTESTIYEMGVKGKTLEQEYDEDSSFFSDPVNRHSLIKLSVQNYFLSLSDLDFSWNIVIDENRDMVPIDFDKAFWFRPPDPKEKLLNPIILNLPNEEGEFEFQWVPYDKLTRQFCPDETYDIVREEMRRIVANIDLEKKKFSSILNLMKHYNGYNIAAKKMYGKKNIADYYMSRYKEFKKIIKK